MTSGAAPAWVGNSRNSIRTARTVSRLNPNIGPALLEPGNDFADGSGGRPGSRQQFHFLALAGVTGNRLAARHPLQVCMTLPHACDTFCIGTVAGAQEFDAMADGNDLKLHGTPLPVRIVQKLIGPIQRRAHLLRRRTVDLQDDAIGIGFARQADCPIPIRNRSRLRDVCLPRQSTQSPATAQADEQNQAAECTTLHQLPAMNGRPSVDDRRFGVCQLGRAARAAQRANTLCQCRVLLRPRDQRFALGHIEFAIDERMQNLIRNSWFHLTLLYCGWAADWRIAGPSIFFRESRARDRRLITVPTGMSRIPATSA